jgi:cysteine desulfurase
MTARSYLDHAASSPMPPQVVAAMADVLAAPGNPSSLHHAGRTARRRLEEARESLAADLGAAPAEVIFTSGGTEANNIVVLGSQRAERRQIVISAVEHASVMESRALLSEVATVPVDASGHLDLAAAEELIGTATALTSVMWVNNETGAIQPIAAVAELARRAGAWAHSDAVQAFGHVPVQFAASGLDLLTVSAHKLGGPVGIGALVVRRGVRLRPSGFGGGQEAKLRSGTVAVALAVGFAAAARLALADQQAERVRLAGLKKLLIDGVARQVGHISVNSVDEASPAIVNLTFAGARADDLLLLLDSAGIDASTGSACTAGLHQPSEVLLAMGCSLEEAGSSLRFSFGRSTTVADVERVLAALPDAVVRARAASH